MFSGLYFGTLGRDFVERVSGIMATTMGYYAHQGFPRKHLREGVCAICGEKVTTRVKSHSHSFQNEDQMLEGEVGVHELGCGHVYHEQCIRYVLFLPNHSINIVFSYEYTEDGRL